MSHTLTLLKRLQQRRRVQRRRGKQTRIRSPIAEFHQDLRAWFNQPDPPVSELEDRLPLAAPTAFSRYVPDPFCRQRVSELADASPTTRMQGPLMAIADSRTDPPVQDAGPISGPERFRGGWIMGEDVGNVPTTYWHTSSQRASAGLDSLPRARGPAEVTPDVWIWNSTTTTFTRSEYDSNALRERAQASAFFDIGMPHDFGYFLGGLDIRTAFSTCGITMKTLAFTMFWETVALHRTARLWHGERVAPTVALDALFKKRIAPIIASSVCFIMLSGICVALRFLGDSELCGLIGAGFAGVSIFESYRGTRRMRIAEAIASIFVRYG